MIGWPVAWWCFVACRLGEESQQFVSPQVRHCRRWTQRLPMATQASQTLWGAGRSGSIWSRWSQMGCTSRRYRICAGRPCGAMTGRPAVDGSTVPAPHWRR